MSSQAVTSRRLNALIFPVCLAGLGVLVAAAYVLAAPRLDTRPEESAHLIAPWAVIAGLGGSVLVAAIAQRSEATARRPVSSSAAGKPLMFRADSGHLLGVPSRHLRRRPPFDRNEEGAHKLGEPKGGPMQVQPSADGASRITIGAER